MPELELRPIRPDEVDAHVDATALAFYDVLHPEARALWAAQVEPGRTLDSPDGEEIVATSGLLSRELTVPGAVVPMAGVSAVGVRADHRRRGLLGRMMRGQLDAIRARGEEAIAALWASEATIYRRYGFDIAARGAELTVRSRDARIPGDDLPRPRLVAPDSARPTLAAIHEAVRPTRPGMLSRPASKWAVAMLRDLEHERRGRAALQVAVLDDGYAIYAVRRENGDDESPAGVVELRELVARTSEAHAALWTYLLRLELTRTVVWEQAPIDEPVVYRASDPRSVSVSAYDSLWVRLVDVPRALAQRRYLAPIDVVLEVADEVIGENAGRFRLTGDESGARCQPTGDPADLALGVRELGAAYLGGTPLLGLADAGRVEERTPGALTAADRGFRWSREPWTPEIF